MQKETDLHRAVQGGDISKVKSLLSKGADVACQNENGDQPAHIAARLGSAECMELLLAYGALGRMRMNWAGLTPIGEARMNNAVTIVSLLKQTHDLPTKTTTETLSRPSEWDTIIEDIIQGWEAVYDEQMTYWVRNRGSNREEFSWTPPAVSLDTVSMAREAKERIVSRRLDSLSKSMLIREKEQYEKERTLNLIMITDLSRKLKSVIKLHRTVRRRAIQNRTKQNLNSVILQRFWKRCSKRNIYISCRALALKLQTNYRMREKMNYFRSFQYERLWWFKATRKLAIIGQRLWRGWKGRAWGRKQIEIRNLPDPAHIKEQSFEFWLECQKQSHPPKEKRGIFLEYTLGGTPLNWYDRRIKRNGRFRDVRYYANLITNKVQWEMPVKWKIAAEKQFQEREQLRQLGYTHAIFATMIRLQQLWRAKNARRKLGMILKAKKVADNAELEYTNRPKAFVSMYNYALLLHAIRHHYDKARPIYCALMEHMHQRGVDHSHILYGYAIFVAATNEEDLAVIENLVARAKAAKGGLPGDFSGTSFFLIGAVRSQTGDGWHNYALCKMLVHDDYNAAKDAFVRAIRASPKDECILRNFDYFSSLHEKMYGDQI